MISVTNCTLTVHVRFPYVSPLPTNEIARSEFYEPMATLHLVGLPGLFWFVLLH